MTLAVGKDIGKIVATNRYFCFSIRRADLKFYSEDKGQYLSLRIAYFYGTHFMQDMKTA
ncbi:hypothetical protein ALC56_09533 [Trachymyrmex septentrionalis]|uniref:Uncharacterized protein n=1 Tax=Trachymyrmex septentrionalis TaxID=34720 RepID=A0A195F689_9HYME|nr:hypothetical protein ALC56_09533 [Trachymyrmex septentrionalis]